MVEHTTGSTNRNFDTFFEATSLLVNADTTVDGEDTNSFGCRQFFEFVSDLLSELACGSEDKRLWSLTSHLDHFEEWDTKGGGLSGPGFGLHDEIAFGQRVFDGRGLDGCGIGIATIENTFEDCVGEDGPFGVWTLRAFELSAEFLF